MRKILVTGSDGFIGRTLVKRLLTEGYEVEGLDLAQGDITDPSCFDSLPGKDFFHVIHLAGKTFVPDSWKDPGAFYRINLMGTVNVLEFCRRTGSGLTYISSYLYGSPEYLPIDENHPVKSYNPYSHSKLLADNTCQFYALNFKLRVSVLRPFNAYGPGQPAHFIIPEIIEMVKNLTVSEVQVMDLRPKRDYVYIDDLVDAIYRTIEGEPGIYNVGSGQSVSVEDLIKTVMSLSGIIKPYKARGTERQNEIFDLYAGIDKIRLSLGWKPKTSFEEGLRKCITP
ncbi:MAG: NAD(P)-dependent oxidoreductase [Bacteroidetes bacterium]|nr:NAD(P)-dependent oxidoreductase [Bacteroidota bacterium]